MGRSRERVMDYWMQFGMKPNDVAMWAMLCGWLEVQPRKCARRYDMPAVLRPLVSTAKEAMAVRRAWHVRGVLPIFWRTGYGWRLRRDWRERLRLAASDEAHQVNERTVWRGGTEADALAPVVEDDFPF